jgi:hypothetical protein
VKGDGARVTLGSDTVKMQAESQVARECTIALPFRKGSEADEGEDVAL